MFVVVVFCCCFFNFDYFWGFEIFVDILGVTSELDNFYGLFLQIKCSCMCSVKKFTLIHT